MKYTISIFDLDGTILNTLEDLADSTNYALKTCGYPERTMDEVRQFVGNGIRKLMERAVPEGTPVEEIDRVHETFTAHYKVHCADQPSPYDGIIELLQNLKKDGCKLAVVDETGKVLHTVVIYPTAPQNKVEESKRILKDLIKKYHISLISVGNGTASRESEQVIVELLKEIPEQVQYVIVNEAGQRSAVSIARRLQDPLSELVKIDPKSIGVGQYQHDMNQKNLSEALQGVVEDCVNSVGVDLNTASASLLSYISGISKTVAKNIVAYREENGVFKTRRELLKVPKLGPKAFEQCAGFLRIQGGKNPLDATSVHPESYQAAETLLARLGYNVKELSKDGFAGIGRKIGDYSRLSSELSIGEITLRDIVKELEKPGRDPRDEMPKPILRTDVLDIKDLKPGMILKGTVRNVIDFGAFVDIGVHQDGLVHISQMTERYIKHPLEAVSVGDVVEVQVLEVDQEKKRIGLTMKIK